MSKVNEFYKHKDTKNTKVSLFLCFLCVLRVLCLLFFIRGNIVDKH